MTHELLILLPISFITGAINAAIGGGGLIGIPAFYSVLTSFSPAQIMGVDKFSSVMGHAMSIRQYAAKMDLPWRLMLPTVITAFAGSYLGVRMLDLMPSQWMRPVIIVVLAIMLVYTWFRPQLGHLDTSRTPTRADLIKGAALGLALGFYDGFIGPGTGSFLLFLFVRFFHFDFLRATACAKVVNFGTNAATLVFLVPAGMVAYELAVPLGVAAICGSVVGSRLAMRGGNQWIRRLFLILAVSLLAKLAWETLRGWL
ncbi:sulfite exporter TauE/SafE family protein [Uliginosibacterium sp. 31-12]|uniref:sulfite exporter TauE/SafE family protein n=1 Tax=Uliginosibacterium sp. 31-12 TaxID=3062781 RepID=UPI0026E38BB5|nr:sulfite exporter TauE/SafE family protein [Uliginosibacterium sp. 31-12]MDO6387270.1 sulfite exporter TauE/SafE family protein [Uliginosibacterium sp. 31-12]